MKETIYLQLADGTIYTGKSFGASLEEERIAELVFTTAMTGYVETLTDPSYYGQIVVQTFPLIGNYGVQPADFESEHIHMSAYITNEWCEDPSNFRSRFDLHSFLQASGVPGIYDIDTRALTKKIRQEGVMNARITTTFPSDNFTHLSNLTMKDAVHQVSCKTPFELNAPLARYHVVLWDFGAKGNIAKTLRSLNCRLTIVPAHTTCEEILALSPDGIMLSNGPGNPADNTSIIEELRKLCTHKLPTFGICLGHQLLALANGASTSKLKYGHRGANQPVKELSSGKIYITSQNHGYAVESNSLPVNCRESFINLNDNTCEGVTYTDFPGFSVQFHPEACAGPHDTAYLFKEFIRLMDLNKN